MGIRLSVLDTTDIERIYGAAVEIMGRTGAVIENRDAVELLGGAGAQIEGGNRVRISPHLIEDALKQAPSRVTVYDRQGEPAMVLGGSNSYFGAHVNCPIIVDSHTGEHRQMTLDDLETAVRVVDALPNIDFMTVIDTVAGVVPQYADAATFAIALANSSKPMNFDLLSLETGSMIFDMAAAAVGGHDQLRAKPFFVVGDSPVSPLYHPADPVAKIMFVAGRGLPCLYNPMPQGGLTAPITTAGVLAITLAEILTGLVICQLVNPGTPFICGGVPSVFDMRDATFVYGSPELFLMCSGLTDIVRHYRLPSFGTAGMTNAKTLDLQAATDVSLSTLMAVLSGSNMVHDVGIIDVGAHSLPQIVLADEIIGMVRHIEKGIEVSEETLALDVIDGIGPKGIFIAEEHTVEHFRECWYPAIFDHTPVNSERKQGNIENKIQSRIDELLARPIPDELPAAARETIASLTHHWTL